MPKRVRVSRSTASSHGTDRFTEAREKLVQARDRLMAEVREIDGILERLSNVRLDRKEVAKETNFDARDFTEPGSLEEEQVAERILEKVFPDTSPG